MTEALTTLAAMSAALRSAPAVLQRCMPKLRAATLAYLHECYERGIDPDGNPWPLNEDGTKSKLSGETVQVTTQGSRIIVSVRLFEALHSKGHARGGKKRALVPADAVPPELLKRWQTIVEGELSEALQL